MDAPVQGNEAELIARAASGEAKAQARLAHLCIGSQFTDVTAFEAFVGAEAFARLAAVQGDEAANMLLAGVLRVRAYHVAALGDDERALSLLAQSEALLDAFPSPRPSEGLEFVAGVLTAQADGGDEFAAERLNRLFAELPAADADHLRRVMNNAVEQAQAPSLEGAR